MDMTAISGGEAIVCFESVSGAILAEQALAEGGIRAPVMPKPSAILKGCGFCLRFAPADLAPALAFLMEKGFADMGIDAFLRTETGGGTRYERIDVNE